MHYIYIYLLFLGFGLFSSSVVDNSDVTIAFVKRTRALLYESAESTYYSPNNKPKKGPSGHIRHSQINMN